MGIIHFSLKFQSIVTNFEQNIDFESFEFICWFMHTGIATLMIYCHLKIHNETYGKNKQIRKTHISYEVAIHY